MGRKLNKNRDDIVQEDLEDLLQKFPLVGCDEIDPGAPPSRRALPLQITGTSYFEIGASLYQQESDVAEIAPYLRAAAPTLLESFSVLEQPGPQEHRVPWEFLKCLYIGLAFGEPGNRKRLSQLPEWAYRHPPGVDNELPSLLAQLIQGYLDREQVDGERARELRDRSAAGSASKQTKRWIEPVVAGFVALSAGDASAMNEAIQGLVKSQESEAKRGEYREISDGFLCLPGLAIARLGLEKGMVCTVESEYLPLELIGGR